MIPRHPLCDDDDCDYDKNGWNHVPGCDAVTSPPTGDDEGLCSYITNIGSLSTPPEYCDDEAEEGLDFCAFHREKLEKLDALVDAALGEASE